MRAARVLIAVAAITGVLLIVDCSQKGSGPTTPADPAPACGLSPTSLGFGDVVVGISADRQFTPTNSGGGTLSGSVTDTSAAFAAVAPPRSRSPQVRR